jgi:antitoxin (DNA-binding transcriptional repressor) of toxin-antitoxin stability system
VRQHLPRPRVGDVEAEAARQVAPLLQGVRPGERIAITAGSRGVGDIVPVLRAVVGAVRRAGAEPLVVAAMGSHGGGTAEGQRKILHGLGVTPEAVGAPIHTGVEVVSLGQTPSGLTAWCDAAAAACDHIVLVNRVKIHTLFSEPFGSGLQKMIVVGLGKATAAEKMHRRGIGNVMANAIAEIAATSLASGKFLGGLAIVENGYEETAILEGIRPERIAERESALFLQANALMPRLPVGDMDVLIVEEMGKNISGTGMDVNITGRWKLPGVPDPPRPHTQRLVVLRLTPQSEGNAVGVGHADVTTQALVDAIDRTSTYLNVLTSSFVERVAIPMIMPNEREAIAAALLTAGVDPAQARVVRIKNTLQLQDIWVSENLAQDALRESDCEIVGTAQPLAYDEDGRLLPA